MDIGKIGGTHLPGIASPTNSSSLPAPQADSPQARDEFTPSPPQDTPRHSGKMASVASQVLLDGDLKPAFRMKEKWAVPRRSGISPHPNVGPNGEINASTFGNFTVVKDGREILSKEMEDPAQKYAGMRTLAVNRPPAFSDDGKAYVPDRSGRLHAFDLGTGEQLWEFNTRNDGGVPSPVLGKGNRLFLRDGEGSLYALDRATGKQQWALKKWAFAFKAKENSVPQPENHPPALAPDGTVFVVGKKGTIHAVDGETGKLKKGFEPYDAGESIYYSFSPFCDDQGRLYVPLRGEKDARWSIACLDGASGKKLWESPTGENMVAPVIAPDGTVLVGTTGATWITKDHKGESQKIMAFRPDDGSIEWETPIAGRIEGITLDPAGKKLAVLHSRTNFIEEWEEIESIDDISLVDMATHLARVNAKPGTSEKDGIHSISFAPDGSLIAYAYPDTVKAFTIEDSDLYVGKDGKALTAGEIQKQQDGAAGSSGDGAKAVIVEDGLVEIDGLKLRKKDGRFQKL
ncbi:MAG: PQQ-binding-like beta-propeller repeat protein [Candidatus Eremiobacteraeota bacterium]|nr:PQQ-binding-like beta-propeller repeat protein [Candidatus Eremiobacteraeota bacterium]